MASKKIIFPFFCIFLFLFSGCKKETREVLVDAFKDLQFEISKKEQVYQLSFTLQPFNYSDYGIIFSTDKQSLFTGINVLQFEGYPIQKNRYGLFINSLEENKTYYYRIFVRNSSTSDRIFSDVFTFTTNL